MRRAPCPTLFILHPRAPYPIRASGLPPELQEAFQTFNQKVFASGALATKTKQLIAVAVAHVTQCPYCIRGHTRAALREGASREELMEAIWVAAEMCAGAAYAHSTLALDEMERAARRVSPTSDPSG